MSSSMTLLEELKGRINQPRKIYLAEVIKAVPDDFDTNLFPIVEAYIATDSIVEITPAAMPSFKLYFESEKQQLSGTVKEKLLLLPDISSCTFKFHKHSHLTDVTEFVGSLFNVIVDKCCLVGSTHENVYYDLPKTYVVVTSTPEMMRWWVKCMCRTFHSNMSFFIYIPVSTTSTIVNDH